MIKIIFISVAFLFVTTTSHAQNVDFKKPFLGSPVLKSGSDKFRVKGATAVTIGAYGQRVSPSGWSSGRDGSFSRESAIDFGTSFTGRIVSIQDKVKKKINTTLKITLPETIENPINGNLSVDGTVNRKIVASIIQMDKPNEYLKKVAKSFYDNNDYNTPFTYRNFRFITGVVQVGEYTITKNINISAGLSGKISPGKLLGNTSINANVGGSTSKNTSIKLSKGSVIGYQWNTVCWYLGKPTSSMVAEPGTNRKNDCLAYCDSFKVVKGHKLPTGCSS